MKNLPNSPQLYSTTHTPVSLSGVVVGVMSTGGFYLAAPSANWDTDASTAEGIPVFYPAGANPACAVVGNVVAVVGNVINGSAVNGANTPGTGIDPASCTVTGTGKADRSIALPATETSFSQLLPYTGMPVSNSAVYAISPTGGTLDEPNEFVTSNGQFFAALSPATNNHLFRTAGIGADEFIPAGAPATVTMWSGNPRRVFLDTTTFGGAPVDIAAGQTMTCSVPANLTVGAVTGIGVIDYTLGYQRLLIFKTSICTVSGTVAPAVAAPADALHFHVGSLNLNRFYNTLGNNAGAVAITPAAYARRLAKVAMAISTYLGKPEVVALEEVQDLSTLTDIGTAVNALAGTQYVPYLAVGNDPNSLNLGFLVDTRTIIVDSVVQESKAATYTTAPGPNGQVVTAPLWERPPLVLNAEVIRRGLNYKVSIFNIQITPRNGYDIGDAIHGPNIRLQRVLQASDLSKLAQAYQAGGGNLLIAGNFAAYSFNDGYVDVPGIILGQAVPASQVTTYLPSSTTSTLYNFENNVDGATKYNIIESGNARSIEHMFASAVNTQTAAAPLSTYASTVTQPHFTTDFPAVMANLDTTPAGLTTHDGFVAAFLIPPVPTTVSATPAALDFGSVTLGLNVVRMVTVTNTTAFTSFVTVSNIALSGANQGDYSQSSNCTTLAQGASCTVTLTFTPQATGTRNASLTVSTDSPNNPTLVTSLTGIGLDTTATLTPTSANFGSVYAGGGVSVAQTFTVTNTSAVPISLGALAVTGDFSRTSTCGASLAPGAGCTVSVIFAPKTVGAGSGTLSVVTGASANPLLTAALTGTGLATTATLAPAALNFGGYILGASSPAQTVTWTNTSGIPLNILSIKATGDFSVNGTNCAGTLAANAGCTASIVFTAGGVGARTGTLTVVSTSTANPTLVTLLSGTGYGDVEPSSALLNFGNVDLGASSPAQTVTLTNHTTAPIALTGLTVQGDYSFTTTCGGVLPGFAACTLSVRFKPTALGTRPGTLIINTNDTKQPTLAISLTGNGVDFSIALNPTAGSTIAGYEVFSTLTMTPLGGFSGPLHVVCTSLAGGSQCLGDADNPVVNGVTTMTMRITTTAQYTVIGYGGMGAGARPWMLLLTLLSAGVLLSLRRSTKALRLIALLLALLTVALGVTGCSGRLPDRNPTPTLPGSYTYTLTASDGFLTRSATYTLNVRVR